MSKIAGSLRAVAKARRDHKRSKECRHVETLLIEPEAAAAIQKIALHDSWLALASEQMHTDTATKWYA